MHLLYLNIGPNTQFEDCIELIERLPSREKLRILKISNINSRMQSLIGRALLIEGLKKYNFGASNLDDICYSRDCKPYFFSITNLSFSISHSRDLVGVLIGMKNRCGLDIEKKSVCFFLNKIPLFKSLFGNFENSYQYLNSDSWTIIECILKADGSGFRGLRIEDAHFCSRDKIWFNKRIWFLKKLFLEDDYNISVVTERKTNIDCQKVTISELIGSKLTMNDGY